MFAHPGVDVHVVCVWPPGELLLLVLEAEHGLGAPEGAAPAQLVLGELLLPDVSGGGAVPGSRGDVSQDTGSSYNVTFQTFSISATALTRQHP